MVVSNNALHPIFPIKDGANRNHMILPINQILYTKIDNFAYLIDLYQAVSAKPPVLPVSKLSSWLQIDATDDDVS